LKDKNLHFLEIEEALAKSLAATSWEIRTTTTKKPRMSSFSIETIFLKEIKTKTNRCFSNQRYENLKETVLYI
jgi:hypothetical protein